jgi:PKHD-type hydroxylase
MILHVANVLNEPQVSSCREVLNNATWVDGRVTAGSQSAGVKDNRQLPEDSPEARKLGEMIIAALERYPLFILASLLLRVFPPLFNRYDPGMSFGSRKEILRDWLRSEFSSLTG